MTTAVDQPMPDELPSRSPGLSGPRLLLLCGLTAVAAALFGIALQPAPKPLGKGDAQGLVGTPMPLLRAAKWINGAEPIESDLRGSVIVIEAWAYWCGPCRKLAPYVQTLADRYGPQGVKFLGLTVESTATLAESEEFIRRAQWTFPQGIGAVDTLRGLRADFIPQMWVIDRQGRIAWDYSLADTEAVEAAIERCLKEAAP